ncbi:ABC transporter ATP-binding protein/permease [Clostridium chauvoei]|uniref:ABC transporter ATP-binding protein n=1 Tax=Clostridium chauvoei TaxID=46867 RepID=UPI00207A77C6
MKKKGYLGYICKVIKIVFNCAPIDALIIAMQKILDGIVPTLEVMFVADFLDKAVEILNGNRSYNEIFLPIILLGSAVAYTWISDKLLGFVQTRLEIKLKETIRVDITEKIAKLEYRHIESEASWNLISRVIKQPEIDIKQGYVNLFSILALVIKISGILAILFSKAWWTGIIILIVSIPLFVLAIKSGKANYQTYKDACNYRRRSDYIGAVLTDRDSVDERTLFNYAHKLNEIWLGFYEKVRIMQYKTQKKWFIRNKMGSVITACLSIFILIILLKPVQEGSMSVGIFISISNAILNLVGDMSWTLTYLMEDLAKNKEYINELCDFFILEECEGAIDKPAQEPVILKTLEFKNVYFKYPGTENYILKNLSFTIKGGKHYSVVGINGAGKTTLTKLITGLYSNFEGDILINGVSIRNYSQAELKALTSVVYKDFAKYNISLRDNIALGNVLRLNGNFIDRDIEKVITTIELDEKVKSLEHGLNSMLGKLKEDGIDLSGGQWQKVAMARSIVSNTSLRILDEPTSALDPISESKVYEKFEEISRGGTTIFISHRLGSTKLSDEIFVIGDGAIVEKGSHEELMELDGVYAKMYESQKEWYAC